MVMSRASRNVIEACLPYLGEGYHAPDAPTPEEDRAPIIPTKRTPAWVMQTTAGGKRRFNENITVRARIMEVMRKASGPASPLPPAEVWQRLGDRELSRNRVSKLLDCLFEEGQLACTKAPLLYWCEP